MLIEEMKDFTEGRSLWYEYIRVNGYARNPTDAGLCKLSRLLDLKKTYISKLIWFFLEN